MVAVAAALVLASSGCGGEEEAPTGPLSESDWQERAGGLCRDGMQDAAALPVPGSVAELARDAAARAEIVAGLREGLTSLGEPDGVSPNDLDAYLDDLSADVDALNALSKAAGRGGDVRKAVRRIDESAGELATRLGQPDCAALSNAIARTA